MSMPYTNQPSVLRLKISLLIKRISGYLYKFSVTKANLDIFISKLGYLGEKAYVEETPLYCNAPHKIFIHDGCKLSRFAQFIISPSSEQGRFIMKKKTIIAQGLLVITNNHSTRPRIGNWQIDLIYDSVDDRDKDVIVEEDVWIGAYVTLLYGVTVGRGAIVGSNSVVRCDIPPYAIVVGNPAKIVGYKLMPDEIIEHEKLLYKDSERLDYDILQKNYNEFTLSRQKQENQESTK